MDDEQKMALAAAQTLLRKIYEEISATGSVNPYLAWVAIPRVTAAIDSAQKNAVGAWHPVDRPLTYLTRCSDGTTFRNVAQMPAHAVEWRIENE